MRRKSIDNTGLDSKTKRFISDIPDRLKISAQGIAGDKISEPIPNFLQTESEKVLSNGSNCWIVLGRDRNASRLSGYGGKGHTHASSIDIVVGRMGRDAKKVNEKNEQLWVDPDFKKDSSRIYISQKSDIDEYFNLTTGKVGNSIARSSIGIKSDAVRIIGREGIKLVTRTEINNSMGGEITKVRGIDLIAGNDDKDLQSMVKGQNITKALERLTDHVNQLNGIVDALVMIQSEFNEALTHHFHYSPYFGAPTTPAIDVVVPKGIKTQINLLSKVKKSLLNHKINLASFRVTYLTPAGGKYVCSRYNNTN